MNTASLIKLMECKLQAYRNGLIRARNEKDTAAIEKWEDGCLAIKERILELQQD
ncbi:MAG: hypothetical protein GXY20_04830 [Clostridiales bacterium]|nr:hypothetical protein [Clostridiales bacterium]